jgi:hypothetical protein
MNTSLHPTGNRSPVPTAAPPGARPERPISHVTSFHGQPCSRAHCRTASWPPAAIEHVLSTHGHPLSFAQANISAVATKSLTFRRTLPPNPARGRLLATTTASHGFATRASMVQSGPDGSARASPARHATPPTAGLEARLGRRYRRRRRRRGDPLPTPQGYAHSPPSPRRFRPPPSPRRLPRLFASLLESPCGPPPMSGAVKCGAFAPRRGSVWWTLQNLRFEGAVGGAPTGQPDSE